MRLGGRQRPVLRVPAGGGQRHDRAARSRQTQGDRQSRREHKESCSHGSPSPAPLAGALVVERDLRRPQARVNEHDDSGACALGLRPPGLGEAFATGVGDLYVHEVAVDPFKEAHIAYLSYYSGGLRVIR